MGYANSLSIADAPGRSLLKSSFALSFQLMPSLLVASQYDVLVLMGFTSFAIYPTDEDAIDMEKQEDLQNQW